MTKTFLVLTVAALLIMGTSAAWATDGTPIGSVQINDLTDSLRVIISLPAAPVGPAGSPVLTFGTFKLTPPEVVSNGSNPGTWNPGTTGTALPTGLRSAVFLEPASDTDPNPAGTVSDIITVNVGAAGADGTQNFTITFASDPFLTAPTALTNSVIPTFTENGSFQDLTTALNTGAAFSLSVASDVPIPGALLLFGTGLAGLAGLRRFRKS